MSSIFFTSDYRPAVQLHPCPAAHCVMLDLTALPAAAYQVRLLGQDGKAAPTQQLAGGLMHCLSLQQVAGPSYGVLVSQRGSEAFVLLQGRLPVASQSQRAVALTC